MKRLHTKAGISRTQCGMSAGFTLIELMIVITILAAIVMIVLPSFIGQSDKAHDAAAKSDLVNVYREAAPLWAERKQIPADIVDQISDNAIPVEQGSHWSKEAVSVNRISPKWIAFRKEAENGDRFLIAASVDGMSSRYRLPVNDVSTTRTNLAPDPLGQNVSSWWNVNSPVLMRSVKLGTDGHPAPSAEMRKAGLTHAIQAVGDSAHDGVQIIKTLGAGETYTCSVWFFAEGDNTVNVQNHGVHDPNWSAKKTVAPSSGIWHSISFTFTTDSPGTWHFASLAHNGTIYVTGPVIEQGAQPGPFFPTAAQLAVGEATWTGAPSDSPSTAPAWRDW